MGKVANNKAAINLDIPIMILVAVSLNQWPAGDPDFVTGKLVWTRPTLSRCNGL